MTGWRRPKSARRQYQNQMIKESFMKAAQLTAVLLLGAFGLGMVGCSTAPKTEEKREALDSKAQSALDAMRSADPSFGQFLDSAYAYAVYPTVGKGGFIASGAYGKGEVMEQGRMIGYSDLTQASVGATIGGQEFTEVVAFQSKAALDKFIHDEYSFAAGVSAVALK